MIRKRWDVGSAALGVRQRGGPQLRQEGHLARPERNVSHCFKRRMDALDSDDVYCRRGSLQCAEGGAEAVTAVAARNSGGRGRCSRRCCGGGRRWRGRCRRGCHLLFCLHYHLGPRCHLLLSLRFASPYHQHPSPSGVRQYVRRKGDTFDRHARDGLQILLRVAPHRRGGLVGALRGERKLNIVARGNGEDVVWAPR